MIPISDKEPAGIFPFWTILIIMANVVVFFLEITSANTDAFITQYALIPAYINFSDPSTLLPLITSQFLHGGFLHIISNMLFLWVFGDNVEAEFGFFYPIFYLACGVVAGLTQYFFAPTLNLPMIGASGAVAGVLGAYFAYFPSHKVKTLIPIFGFFTLIDVPASIMLIYWIVTQFISGAFSLTYQALNTGGVAYFAHIGGFVFGILVAKLLSPQAKNLRLESY